MRLSLRGRRHALGQDQRPFHTPGHAWYCDCGSCMADDGRSQRTRMYGCPCSLPSSMCPPGYREHDEPTCPKRGERVWIS